MKRFLATLGFVFTGATAGASPVTITAVEARETAPGKWRFAVTLDHADTGWDHYTNKWDVATLDGETLLGERVLTHPHVNEMPFTRAQGGIQIPAGTTQVLIRAYDNLSDAIEGEVIFDLPVAE